MTTRSSSPVGLVVGARSVISRVIAEGLSDLGYSLVVEEGAASPKGIGSSEPDRGVRDLLKRGGQVIVGHHDFTTHDGAQEAIRLATKTFGTIDIVVVLGELCTERAFLRVEPESWSTLVAGHLTTAFNICQATAHWMTDHQRRGRLICLTGSDGAVTTDFGRVHLAGVMGGIFSLTRAMAVELRPKGITVNAIASSLEPPQEERVPSNRTTSHYASHNILPMIEFLVSEKALEITGQVISVDGAKVSVVRSVKSAGAIAEGSHWTPEEIGRRWGELSR